jgi:hypothetical protein
MRPIGAGQTIVDIAAHWLVPVTVVGCIDRIIRPVDWNLDTAIGHQEGLALLIEDEDICAVALGQDQRSLRTVKDKTGCELRPPWLKQRCRRIFSADRQNRKDAAD